ncbi:MAG: BON domain-containing protein [Acidobacteriota bacterium]|nr:BON domain-containing protein [Acidobacteriota bacterium]MDH3529824.1 BON domain-containing protein [Acidobacteriota bacterium]
MKIKLLTALSISLVLFLGACGGASDTDLQSAADKALKAETTTSGVTVEVKEGVATIKGDVADQAAKAKAEELAKVEGVKNVINEVNVNAPAPMPEASGDDSEVKAKIEEAFKKKGCDGATVEVKDGTATIGGSVKADKFAECVMAVNEAKPKKVENKLEKK